MRAKQHLLHAEYRTMPLFAGCTARELRTLASVTTRVTFRAGKVLARQGECRREFGVIVDGVAAVDRDGLDVDELGRGDHFGESTVLRGLPSPATVVATSPITIDVVSQAEFEMSLGANDVLRTRIEHGLDRRIRDWVCDAASVPASNVDQGAATFALAHDAS